MKISSTINFSMPSTPVLQQNVLFPVHTFGKVLWINSREITYLQGEGNYTFINTVQGKRYLVSKSLKTVQKTMNAGFVRIHKSFLVNPAYVSVMQMNAIELRDGKVIPIARRRAKEIHSTLLDVAQ